MLTLAAPRVIADVGTENHASSAVATKIRMRREGEVEFYGAQHWRYAGGVDP